MDLITIDTNQTIFNSTSTKEEKQIEPNPVVPVLRFRTDLAEKIFLDRYSLKSPDKTTLNVGDKVVFNPDYTGEESKREIGVVVGVNNEDRTVKLKYKVDQFITLPIEAVDKPLETEWSTLADRVARAIALVEGNKKYYHDAYQKFYKILAEQTFVPGGRILAGAGAPGDLTFYNCFVIPSPKDSRKGILDTAMYQFEIMSRGGGVGINVSSLRPRYDYVTGVNGRSSGAVSWAELYSFLTGRVEQGGSRRGALMLIMDIWHPDIEAFINSKKASGVLENANISVAISDAFMKAVEENEDWTLCFPDRKDSSYDSQWDGDLNKWIAKGGKTIPYKTVKARDLYHTICESAWASAEPGLFFVDRVNNYSNSNYYENLRCTNPCGEQPLPAWGVCNLGALNLAKFSKANEQSQFWNHTTSYEEAVQRVDWDKVIEVTRAGVHFLDNVIDSTVYFFEENETQQKSERRVGLGVMGLAELLVKIGVRYGSPESVKLTEKLFELMRNSAYYESTQLAKLKGPFPRFDAHSFSSEFTKSLPDEIQESIKKHGIRNVTLLTVAPTGTTGTMMATSTGIEPYFMFEFQHSSRLGTHVVREAILNDYYNENTTPHTECPQFVTTEDLKPLEHVGIMAAAQKYVDAAISKTCNLPADYSVSDVEQFYKKLYEMGCKGGTVYRDKSRDKQVLTKIESKEEKESIAPPVDPVKRLPEVPRPGFTTTSETPLGKVHVTLNVDPRDNSPFEVLITLSKAGSDTDADTDALARLLSLLLRMNSNVPASERLNLATDQLRGIATSRSVGFGPNRVRSVPDGIGKCLGDLLNTVNTMNLGSTNSLEPHSTEKSNGKANGKNGKSSHLETCPSCGMISAAHVDSCFKCFSCGYALC